MYCLQYGGRMKTLVLSSEQCRWARRVLGLSQRELSNESGKSLSYIKQFETGRFNPGEDFQRELRSFFESRDIDLTESGDAAQNDSPQRAVSPPVEAARPGQPG